MDIEAPLGFQERPGPLLYVMNGNREPGPARVLAKADFGVSPCFGDAGHGVYRSSFEVYRLQRGVCIYRRRAALFPRQTVYERPQALQAVQGEARSRGAEGTS